VKYCWSIQCSATEKLTLRHLISYAAVQIGRITCDGSSVGLPGRAFGLLTRKQEAYPIAKSKLVWTFSTAGETDVLIVAFSCFKLDLAQPAYIFQGGMEGWVDDRCRMVISWQKSTNHFGLS